MQAKILTPTVVVIVAGLIVLAIITVSAMITDTTLSATFGWFEGGKVEVGRD